MKTETSIYLQLLLEPLNKLSQSPTAVRNLVLLDLWHFRIRLALVLEACVPACARISVSISARELGNGVWPYRNQLVHELLQFCPVLNVSAAAFNSLFTMQLTAVLPWKTMGS